MGDNAAGMPPGFVGDTIGAVAGFAVCFAIRGCGLSYGLALPTYRGRAGRTAEELKQLGL